jgi:hypothetical protein
MNRRALLLGLLGIPVARAAATSSCGNHLVYEVTLYGRKYRWRPWMTDDHTLETCRRRFQELPRFKGEPFIPLEHGQARAPYELLWWIDFRTGEVFMSDRMRSMVERAA